jgi:Bacterial archaeo-eukaryotic release factor family 2
MLVNLSAFRPLYDHPGPYASVYLDASHDVPHADEQIRLRWRDLREGLAAEAPAGAAATLDAVDAAIEDARPAVGDAGLAVFAAGGATHLMSTMPIPPPRDSASWSTYPRIASLIRSRRSEARWMQVVVDRTGGILATPRQGHVAIRGPETYPIQKVSAGGWSQSRYQRAAETTWDRNAADVADAVTATANRIGADVIVVAGDDHAREMLVSRLPKVIRERVVPAETRAYEPGTDTRPLDEATRHAIDEFLHARLSTVLDTFQAGLADEGAVTGLPAVTAAARLARIQTLILTDTDAGGEVWVDPRRPSLVAPEPQTLRDFQVAEPVREDSDAALLAAAAVTDADLYVVAADGGPLADGAGAIVRYAA